MIIRWLVQPEGEERRMRAWALEDHASDSRHRGGGGSGGGGGYVATPLSVGSKTPRAFRATTAARIVPTATASLSAQPFMVG